MKDTTLCFDLELLQAYAAAQAYARSIKNSALAGAEDAHNAAIIAIDKACNSISAAIGNNYNLSVQPAQTALAAATQVARERSIAASVAAKEAQEQNADLDLLVCSLILNPNADLDEADMLAGNETYHASTRYYTRVYEVARKAIEEHRVAAKKDAWNTLAAAKQEANNIYVAARERRIAIWETRSSCNRQQVLNELKALVQP